MSIIRINNIYILLGLLVIIKRTIILVHIGKRIILLIILIILRMIINIIILILLIIIIIVIINSLINIKDSIVIITIWI